jgi:carbonic anhydrase
MSNIIYPSQSPIDLGKANAITHQFPPSYFHREWDTEEIGKIAGSGEHCEINFENSKSFLNLVLPGEDSPTRFSFVKYHIHGPNEHRVPGQSYPIEMHIVHEKKINDALNNLPFRSIYVVVAIFIDIDSRVQDKKVNKAAEYFRSLVEIKTKSNSIELGNSIDMPPVSPSHFLPDNPEEYYRYEGSLTTNRSAPNPEFASWIVLKNPKLLPETDVHNFLAKYRHQPKEVQPLERRFVFFNPSQVYI